MEWNVVSAIALVSLRKTVAVEAAAVVVKSSIAVAARQQKNKKKIYFLLTSDVFHIACMKYVRVLIYFALNADCYVTSHKLKRPLWSDWSLFVTDIESDLSFLTDFLCYALFDFITNVFTVM